MPILAGNFLGVTCLVLEYTDFQSIMLLLHNSIQNLQPRLSQQTKLTKISSQTTDKQQTMFSSPTPPLLQTNKQKVAVSKNPFMVGVGFLINKSCPYGCQRYYLKCGDKNELLAKQDNYTKTSESVNCIMIVKESSLTFC